MAADSLAVTGPNFQQTSIDALLVTPTGGSQQALADSLQTGNVSYATYYFTGTIAATTLVFFLATRSVKIVAMSEIHSTAAGGTSTLTVIKDSTTNAPGAGTVVQTGSFDLNATANTVQTATLATAATITLAAGDRLAVKYANTIQSSAGVVVTVAMMNV